MEIKIKIKVRYELLFFFPFFQPLKKVGLQTEILGNLFKYIYCLVLSFCLLLRRLAVRISLSDYAWPRSGASPYKTLLSIPGGKRGEVA